MTLRLQFWNDQNTLGLAFKAYVKSHNLTPLPFRRGDRPYAPPDQNQIANIRNDPSSSDFVCEWLWPVYDDFAQYDVISGAVPISPDQQKKMDDYGLPIKIQNPFIQVVLVTNTGKLPLPEHLYMDSDITIALGQLRFVGQQAVDPSLAKKQSALPREVMGALRGGGGS